MRTLIVFAAVLGLAIAALLVRPPGPDLDLDAVIRGEAVLPGWVAALGARFARLAPRVESFATGERVVILQPDGRLDHEVPPDRDHASRIATLVLREGPDLTLRYECRRIDPDDRCPPEPEGRPPALAEGESVTFDIGPGGGTIRSGVARGRTVIAFEQ